MDNQGKIQEEVTENITKTRQTFKAKQETLQTRQGRGDTNKNPENDGENKGSLSPTQTMILTFLKKIMVV